MSWKDRLPWKKSSKNEERESSSSSAQFKSRGKTMSWKDRLPWKKSSKNEERESGSSSAQSENTQSPITSIRVALQEGILKAIALDERVTHASKMYDSMLNTLQDQNPELAAILTQARDIEVQAKDIQWKDILMEKPLEEFGIINVHTIDAHGNNTGKGHSIALVNPQSGEILTGTHGQPLKTVTQEDGSARIGYIPLDTPFQVIGNSSTLSIGNKVRPLKYDDSSSFTLTSETRTIPGKKYDKPILVQFKGVNDFGITVHKPSEGQVFDITEGIPMDIAFHGGSGKYAWKITVEQEGKQPQVLYQGQQNHIEMRMDPADAGLRKLIVDLTDTETEQTTTLTRNITVTPDASIKEQDLVLLEEKQYIPPRIKLFHIGDDSQEVLFTSGRGKVALPDGTYSFTDPHEVYDTENLDIPIKHGAPTFIPIRRLEVNVPIEIIAQDGKPLENITVFFQTKNTKAEKITVASEKTASSGKAVLTLPKLLIGTITAMDEKGRFDTQNKPFEVDDKDGEGMTVRMYAKGTTPVIDRAGPILDIAPDRNHYTVHEHSYTALGIQQVVAYAKIPSTLKEDTTLFYKLIRVGGLQRQQAYVSCFIQIEGESRTGKAVKRPLTAQEMIRLGFRLKYDGNVKTPANADTETSLGTQGIGYQLEPFTSAKAEKQLEVNLIANPTGESLFDELSLRKNAKLHVYVRTRLMNSAEDGTRKYMFDEDGRPITGTACITIQNTESVSSEDNTL